MNGKITITKEKYRELVEKAGRFEVIQKLAADSHDFFQEPATKSMAAIIKEMEKTGLYSKSFLKSLGLGLRKSTYFSK
ncbi:MAG: hypothetical protein HYT38_00430 [Candidatus Sungbacteria bacterium]|uniref:Uncharacterized protein n=1 Tax=Candidatus Sungiibacteriota bacterium TaxID=2750080 RepID=A0A932DSI1_9BACT|nr:hypothetical protein [Candidatus Sungbacteria bacterium]MBI2465899.1 hypothetical protein [Candidatus Sungbacteria bacterium]